MQIGCFTTFHYSEELTEEKDRYDHHYYWMLRHNPAQVHAMHENYYIDNYNILPNVREHEKYWELNSKGQVCKTCLSGQTKFAQTHIYLYYCAGLYFLCVGSGNKHLVTLTDAKHLLEERQVCKTCLSGQTKFAQTPVENNKKASQRRMSEKEIRFNAYAIIAAYEYEKNKEA